MTLRRIGVLPFVGGTIRDGRITCQSVHESDFITGLRDRGTADVQDSPPPRRVAAAQYKGIPNTRLNGKVSPSAMVTASGVSEVG